MLWEKKIKLIHAFDLEFNIKVLQIHYNFSKNVMDNKIKYIKKTNQRWLFQSKS